MIVCHCAGVSERTIHTLISSGARSVRDITRLCGAGRCCAPCRDEIASLIGGAAVAAETYSQPASVSA